MRRLALALALLWPSWALAQNAPSANPAVGIAGAYNSAPLTCTNGQACWLQTDANGQLKVTASVSASVAGFAPGGVYATLTASGSSADVALPAGEVVAFQNSGTTTVSCILSVGAGVATASKNLVPPSSTVYLTVGANTHGSCIDQSGSTSNVIVLSGGAGIGTGFGGGGGGSGGGGAVTVADGADVTEGAIADAAATAGSTGTVSAKLRLATTLLDTIATNTAGGGGGDASAANQTNGNQKTQIVDGSGNVIAATSNALNVAITNLNPNGQAVMASSAPVAIASNQSAIPVTQSGSWVSNVTQWATTSLGAPTAWGSAPSGNVIGVNANIVDGINANGRASVAGSAPVVSAYLNYQAVAASSTATVLQTSTGATGDYLSHCVLYPTSTTAGLVTVFDGTDTAANNVIAFPGGASSTSNLTPITIPVGAISVHGAWKVTTGSAISVVCYGDFS